LRSSLSVTGVHDLTQRLHAAQSIALSIALAVFLRFIVLLAIRRQPMLLIAMPSNDIVGFIRWRFMQLLDESLVRSLAVFALGMLRCALHFPTFIVTRFRHRIISVVCGNTCANSQAMRHTRTCAMRKEQ
jgi:hypothetical protein